jgi:hypothetical protein
MSHEDAEFAQPAIPPGHFAVNVPLPGVLLPDIIVRRDSEAAVASLDAVVLGTTQRHDSTVVVKVCVAKKLAISMYKQHHPDEKAPEAKAIGALMVRHIAGLIMTHIKSSIEQARSALACDPPQGALIWLFVA